MYLHVIIAIIYIELTQASAFPDKSQLNFKVFFSQLQERIKLVEAYFATKSIVQIQRQFPKEFPETPQPGSQKRLLDKFRVTESVLGNIECLSGQPRSARTENYIATARKCLDHVPRKSIRRLSKDTDLSISSVMRNQDLHMFAYNIQRQTTNSFDNFRPMQQC